MEIGIEKRTQIIHTSINDQDTENTFNLMNAKKQNNELSFFICLTDKDYNDVTSYIGKTVGVVGIL